MTTYKYRWAAALAAAAIALPGVAAPTLLVPANAATVEAPPTHLIDKDRGDIYVVKYANDTGIGTEPGTGLDQESAIEGAEPLAGAVFKLEQVEGVDLKTNEGWEKASKIAKGTEEATFKEVRRATTDEDGYAEFTDLPLGLYRVTEVAAPAGYEITTEPYFVTLPLTDPETNNKWLYEVYTFPKNKKQEDPIVKTVNDAEAIKPGDTIKYDVVTKLPSAEKLAGLTITDKFPADRLEDPTVESVTLGDGSNLTADTDYTVDGAKVTLTPAGLEKLDALKGENRKVTTRFNFKVKEIPGETELDPIQNNADFTVQVDPDTPGTPTEVPEGERPETYYGNVKVTKTGDEGAPLSDVEFELYRCNSAQDPRTKPILTGLKTDAGSLTIPSLHVNDWVNGENKTSDPSGYCLAETKSAEGYALLAEPIYFQVLKDGQNQVALTDLEVKNVKNNGGFDLPLTGGSGVTLLLIVGGLIMAGGAAYMVRNNRQEKKA